jgi:hypothetical protein
MNLGPGESIPIMFNVPPKLAEALKRGEVTFEQGPIVEARPCHYERMVEMRLNGETFGYVTLEWDEEPLTWRQRLWNWLRGVKHDPGNGLTVEHHGA